MDVGSYPPCPVLQLPLTQRCLEVNVGQGDAGLRGTKDIGGWMNEGQEDFFPPQP